MSERVAPKAGSLTGRGIDRVDAHLKVMGQATYAAEFAVANVAYGVIVTSQIGAGRISAMDTGAASAAPGVVLVLTSENAVRLPGAPKHGATPNDRLLQILQDETIHYNDQPIAVVVATTLENAEFAAGLLQVSYEKHAVEVDLERELRHRYAPQSTARGPVDSSRGDFDRAFAHAAVKVEQTYTTPVQNHNPMEMHATLAVWHGHDDLTIYDSTQGIFGVRKKLAMLFGLPEDAVRVISPYVGGGFGCKGTPWSHVALTAMAARTAGRPVKLAVTRSQMFSLVGHRPTTIQHISLGANSDGKLEAIRHDVVSETSRFDEFVEPAAAQTRMLYACPNVRTSHRLVRLDVPTPTFMRAPGESTGTFALEVAMDELAYALKVDPIELRLRNYADRDPESGKPWSSKSLRECYRAGAERFGWVGRPPIPRSRHDGHWLVGWGMATSTYPANVSPASAVAKIRSDGSAVVLTGSQDIGTGTYTIMTQIAADALALPLARVHFDLGDTRFPQAPLSAGSRTAASVGPAVKMAAIDVLAMLKTMAVSDARSPLYGMDPTALDASDGVLFAAGKRDRYADLITRANKLEIEARAFTKESEEQKAFSTHSFGAQFAEVRVDEDLGEVRVSRMVAAFAAGKILNAKTARSQFLGAMVWGVGYALLERTVRDARDGRAVVRDLSDYHVPVHADIPAFEVIMVDEDDPHVNAVGAKGIGEIGTTGSVAAIANAVYHATGKRIRDLPITPDKLL